MIKVYSYDCTDKLSPHFSANEFRCKCGKSHDYNVSEELVEKLESLYTALECSKIVVSSGYRCISHDKAVGGNGNGQHTKGTAADICCYGKDGNPISSKLVCCKAQDIGFTGIARINDTYTHVDVRSGKWYGDETKGNSYCIPCKDFYEYYGIGKNTADEYKVSGIDVSVHNGNINWSKVKASGIKFAIIRAGYGRLATQKDKKFEDNYAGAKDVGLPVGLYWYSYATTVDEVKTEAQVCIDVIRGKQFEYPVFFDLEEKNALATGKANCSEMVRAFCNELEKAKYWAGLYTSRSVLGTHIEDDIKSRYALWVAEWGTKLNYNGTVGMWQNSETGKVDGINGNVDTDVCYKDYPSLIKAKGLNGFGSNNDVTEPTQPAPSTDPTGDTNDDTAQPSVVDDDNTITVEVSIGDKKYKGKITKE